MKLQPLLTQGEIAALLGVSVKTLQRCERFWGLVRVPMPSRSARYEKHAALKALVERGLLSPQVAAGCN